MFYIISNLIKNDLIVKSQLSGLSYTFVYDFVGSSISGCEVGVRVAGCGLRVAGYGLRVTGYGLRDTGCGLRGAGCELRDTGCVLRVMRWQARGIAQSVKLKG